MLGHDQVGHRPARRDTAVARHRDAREYFTPLIPPRNTTIPTRKSEIFSTAADSQTERRRSPRHAGRTPDGARQQDDWALSFDRASAGAARRAADRSRVRHRCRQHPCTSARRTSAQANRRRSLSPRRAASRRKRSRRCGRKPKRIFQKRGQKLRRAGRIEGPAASWRVYETEKLMKEHKDLIGDEQRKKLEDALAKIKDALQDGKLRRDEDCRGAIDRSLARGLVGYLFEGAREVRARRGPRRTRTAA